MRDTGSIPQADPLAFFLTWTAYGSWLPGDNRGWVDGRGRAHGPEPLQYALALRRMAEEAVSFDRPQRVAVEEAIAAHCRVRGWHLHAVECRSQHVHVVVTAVGRAPGRRDEAVQVVGNTGPQGDRSLPRAVVPHPMVDGGGQPAADF